MWCGASSIAIASNLAELMQKTAAEHGFSIEEMDIMPDHVHLFVRATPSHFILWNPSYYVGTVGHISGVTRMPRLYGFCKTLRLPVLMTARVADQFQGTTDLFREVVEYYLLVFREHLELLEDFRWLTTAERLTHLHRNIMTLTTFSPTCRWDFGGRPSPKPTGWPWPGEKITVRLPQFPEASRHRIQDIGRASPTAKSHRTVKLLWRGRGKSLRGTPRVPPHW